jgi:hypothetical protein
MTLSATGFNTKSLSAVVGASPLPLSDAGRAFIEVTTSIRARKAAKSLALHRRSPKRRRLRMGLPESRVSVLECTIGRSVRVGLSR